MPQHPNQKKKNVISSSTFSLLQWFEFGHCNVPLVYPKKEEFLENTSVLDNNVFKEDN
jgi:hypothetical protein